MTDDDQPDRPPSRPVVIVIEADRRLSVDEIAHGLNQMTELFQRVTVWGSPKAFMEDQENEYLEQAKDPFVNCQPTGLYH